jgi:hypothetical protein
MSSASAMVKHVWTLLLSRCFIVMESGEARVEDPILRLQGLDRPSVQPVKDISTGDQN